MRKKPQVSQERIDAVKTLHKAGVSDTKISRVLTIGHQTISLIKDSDYKLESYRLLVRDKNTRKKANTVEMDALMGMVFHIEEMVEKLTEQLVEKDDTSMPTTFFKHDAANQQSS